MKPGHWTRPTNLSPLSAIALSLLLHLALIRVVIITFPLRPVALKPTLVFWGGILQQQDFFRKTDGETFPQFHAPQKKVNLTKPMGSNVIKNVTIPKPAFSKEIPGQKKTSYKSVLPDLPDAQNEEDPLEKLGISPGIPARTPLKLGPASND